MALNGHNKLAIISKVLLFYCEFPPFLWLGSFSLRRYASPRAPQQRPVPGWSPSAGGPCRTGRTAQVRAVSLVVHLQHPEAQPEGEARRRQRQRQPGAEGTTTALVLGWTWPPMAAPFRQSRWYLHSLADGRMKEISHTFNLQQPLFSLSSSPLFIPHCYPFLPL